MVGQRVNGFRTEEFQEVFQAFREHRRKLKAPMTARAEMLIMRRLADLSEEDAIACLDMSIERGWKGVFPENLKQEEPAKSWWQE